MGASEQVDDPDRWARWRFAIIGPLLAAPPAHGELQAALRELSAKSWRHPLTGLAIRLSAATLERWFYAAAPARIRSRRYAVNAAPMPDGDAACPRH